MLTLTDGSLVLEDAKTAEGIVEPVTRFGFSAFGPVRVRAVAANGVAGDWVALGTLVRLPSFKDLRCPRAMSKPCMLSGSNLFLAASIGATPQLDTATSVPPEFTGTELVVQHPTNGQLYLKLRDDPATVQTVTLPVTTISLSDSKAAAIEPPASEPIPVPSSTPAALPPNAPTPAPTPDPTQTSAPPPAGIAPPPDAVPAR